MPSPLGGADAVVTVDEAAERAAIADLARWRRDRDGDAVRIALANLEAAARLEQSVMPASIACAKVGVTTGEWAACLRAVYGEYRAPTGVAATVSDAASTVLRAEVARVAGALGRPLTILVGKPGLDGHSNGARADRHPRPRGWHDGDL